MACISKEGGHQWWLSLETAYHNMGGIAWGGLPAFGLLWLCASMHQAGMMIKAVCELGRHCTLLAPNLRLLTNGRYFIALVWQQLQPSPARHLPVHPKV